MTKEEMEAQLELAKKAILLAINNEEFSGPVDYDINDIFIRDDFNPNETYHQTIRLEEDVNGCDICYDAGENCICVALDEVDEKLQKKIKKCLKHSSYTEEAYNGYFYQLECCYGETADELAESIVNKFSDAYGLLQNLDC